MRRIVFRADGNSKTGLGHMYRCFALADMLKESFACVLITRSDSLLSVIPQSLPHVIVPVNVSPANESSWLNRELEPARDIVVIDSYEIGADYQFKLKQSGFKVVVIDDLTTGHFYADVVVNHSPAAAEHEYQCEPYVRFALGTGYAMLRPEFLEAAKLGRRFIGGKSIFVCFGGADPFNFTERMSQLLLKHTDIGEINIVAGAASSLNRGAIGTDKRVIIHSGLGATALRNLMQRSARGIVPTSTVLFEVCSVRMPVLTGYYAENQRRAYEGFVAKGAALGAGDLRLAGDRQLEDLVGNLLVADEAPFVKSQSALIDGLQAERFNTLFRSL